MIAVGSRVLCTPKDLDTLPDDHSGQGTVREVQWTGVLSPPREMFWVEFDGLPEWKWNWFWSDELTPLEESGVPSNRIGDTMPPAAGDAL